MSPPVVLQSRSLATLATADAFQLRPRGPRAQSHWDLHRTRAHARAGSLCAIESILSGHGPIGMVTEHVMLMPATQASRNLTRRGLRAASRATPPGGCVPDPPRRSREGPRRADPKRAPEDARGGSRIPLRDPRQQLAPDLRPCMEDVERVIEAACERLESRIKACAAGKHTGPHGLEHVPQNVLASRGGRHENVPEQMLARKLCAGLGKYRKKTRPVLLGALISGRRPPHSASFGRARVESRHTRAHNGPWWPQNVFREQVSCMHLQGVAMRWAGAVVAAQLQARLEEIGEAWLECKSLLAQTAEAPQCGLCAMCGKDSAPVSEGRQQATSHSEGSRASPGAETPPAQSVSAARTSTIKKRRSDVDIWASPALAMPMSEEAMRCKLMELALANRLSIWTWLLYRRTWLNCLLLLLCGCVSCGGGGGGKRETRTQTAIGWRTSGRIIARFVSSRHAGRTDCHQSQRLETWFHKFVCFPLCTSAHSAAAFVRH